MGKSHSHLAIVPWIKISNKNKKLCLGYKNPNGGNANKLYFMNIKENFIH